MTTGVVVGGGIAGILSALLLKERLDRVVLIEKSGRIGGLLNSYRNEEGYEFDFGTHVLARTGIEGIDRHLFEHFNPKEWQQLDYVKTGNFFKGQLNQNNPHMDMRLLPKAMYQTGMMQMFEAEGPRGEYVNLEEQLMDCFGTVFTENVFRPTIKKFLNHDLRELAPNGHQLFQLMRLTGLTPEITNQLKKIKKFDAKLSYHSNHEGATGAKKFYPRYMGVGAWIKILKESLRQMGVEVLTEASLESIRYEGDRIIEIKVKDQPAMSCDALVWTIAIPHLFRACGWDMPQSKIKPSGLTTTLFHFVVDKPFLTDLHYVTCFDQDITSWRLTLYTNLQGHVQNRGYHLTAEMLSKERPDIPATRSKILADLKRMGVLSQETKLMFEKSMVVENGFYVLTPEFVKYGNGLLANAGSRLQNVIFAGKARGDAFSMHEVLVKAYKEINHSFENAIQTPAGQTVSMTDSRGKS